MSKKINILIISHEPLTPHLKKMYCINNLKANFDVEFISLRSIYYGRKSKFFRFNNELNNEFIDFSNILSFRSYLKKFKKNNTYVFLEISENHFYSVLISLILADFKKCKFHLYASFQSDDLLITKRNLYEKFVFYSKNLRILKTSIVRKLINSSYRLVFKSGKKNKINLSNNFIPINSTIVDKNDLVSKSMNYVVFIDQGYPTHPDLIKRGYHHKNIEKFIEHYNDFFENVEKKYNTEVVIAKHPKSSISDALFAGRKIFVNRTEELIKNSKYVIAHFSLINNVAIANYKPIILIYNSLFKKLSNSSYQQIIRLAKILNIKSINIESYEINDIEFKLNKSKYSKYINDFIFVDKRENHQIIRDEIIKDFSK